MNSLPHSRSIYVKFRLYVFACSLLIYSCFGVPTPNDIGWVEIITGCGLILSVGIPHAAFLFWNRMDGGYRPLWMTPAWLLLIYGMSCSLLMAMVQGHQMMLIFRDIIPFLFMLLPLFMYEMISKFSAKECEFVLWITIAAGMIFSLRSLYIFQYQGGFADIDALYLANAPTVLFAAIYMVTLGMLRFRFRAPILPLALIGIAVIPMMAMGDVLQRASFGAIAISATLVWVSVCRQSLLRAGFFIGLAGLVLWLFQEGIYDLVASLHQKHENVGGNMRFQELEAVWEHVSAYALTAFFGNGWGAPITSPAVGGLTVNFTHSLISASLLKTGIIGTILVIFYLGALGITLVKILYQHPALAIALCWPFLIDIFLYASYKSLDFGLILMVIACYGVKGHKLNIQNSNRIEGNEHKTHRIGQSDISADTGTYRPSSL